MNTQQMASLVADKIKSLNPHCFVTQNGSLLTVHPKHHSVTSIRKTRKSAKGFG